jgi:hypothetical protein
MRREKRRLYTLHNLRSNESKIFHNFMRRIMVACILSSCAMQLLCNLTFITCIVMVPVLFLIEKLVNYLESACISKSAQLSFLAANYKFEGFKLKKI